jgi:hypothetical protein
MPENITPKENSSQKPKKSEGLGCFVRMLWMGAGPIALLLSFFIIAREHSKEIAPVWADYLYLGIILLMIVIRYVDIRSLDGRTAANQPATMRHWWRYVLLVLLIGFACLVGAHALSYHAVI